MISMIRLSVNVPIVLDTISAFCLNEFISPLVCLMASPSFLLLFSRSRVNLRLSFSSFSICSSCFVFVIYLFDSLLDLNFAHYRTFIFRFAAIEAVFSDFKLDTRDKAFKKK